MPLEAPATPGKPPSPRHNWIQEKTQLPPFLIVSTSWSLWTSWVSFDTPGGGVRAFKPELRSNIMWVLVYTRKRKYIHIYIYIFIYTHGQNRWFQNLSLSSHSTQNHFTKTSESRGVSFMAWLKLIATAVDRALSSVLGTKLVNVYPPQSGKSRFLMGKSAISMGTLW